MSHTVQQVETPAKPPGPLSAIPLFDNLPTDIQEALFAAMRLDTVDAHQTICWFGDTADGFFIIQDGEVTVSVPNDNGELVAISKLKAGDFFGEVGLLDGGPRTATVRADTPVALLRLERLAFHQFLADNPLAAIEMLTEMGRRHRETSETVKVMKNANVVFARAHTGLWQRCCDVISSVAASPAFTIFHVVLFILWIGWNMILPEKSRFDPFPYGLLTVICSLEAIFLSIFVMVSQNGQSEKDRLRTDMDYQVNVKAQIEIMSIARRLERIEASLQRNADRINETAN